MSLHWSTDPLLYDEQPIKYNNWETANSLIEQKGLAAVVQSDHSLTNLYGILVRKIDFVRSTSRDRIIARFPFLIIDTLLKEKLLPHLLSLAEVVHHYFYKSIDKSILTWKKVISEYLEKGVLPLPVFRCAQEVLPNLSFPIVNDSLHLQSARGEAFTFPTKLTSKLAYLCGICNGDGNLRDYWIIVADETKEHIEFISKLFIEMFSKEGAIMKTGGAWIVKLNLLWGARLFNFLTNHAIDEPKYASLREPQLFQYLGEPYRSIYWSGVFDADGSYKNQIVFSTIKEEYAQDFHCFLSDHSIESNFFVKTGSGYQINILAKDKTKIAELLCSLHPKKRQDFIEHLEKTTQMYEFHGINLERLTPTGYFNYIYLPTMSVIGLSKYFENISPKTSLFTKQEIHTYRSNNGITIQKLLKHLQETNQDLMLFLDNHVTNLFFRSASSPLIKLPLRPTSDFERLAKSMIPTNIGATLYNSTEELTQLRNQIFGLQSSEEVLVNQLIGKFLRTFGDYKDLSINSHQYLKKWQERLNKK